MHIKRKRLNSVVQVHKEQYSLSRNSEVVATLYLQETVHYSGLMGLDGTSNWLYSDVVESQAMVSGLRNRRTVCMK